MLKISDKEVNNQQLGKELVALNLPDFTGVYRGSRQIDDLYQAVLDEDGRPKKVQRYILVKCGELTEAQEVQVQDVVAAHIPAPMQDKAAMYKIERLETVPRRIRENLIALGTEDQVVIDEDAAIAVEREKL